MAMKAAPIDKLNGISSTAVELRTGMDWPQWIKILDAAGAADMTHREIVAYLCDTYGVGPWWQQMVTVGYERYNGKRVKHETEAGFQISRSKTIHAPLKELFAAWHDRRKRARWLADPHFTVRKATPDHSLRITWVDGHSSLSVMFHAKDGDKSQVTVDQTGLTDEAEAEQMKTYWTQQLERLKVMLEN
jgi:uncharacterized protein YndB with AHSA1/START domain